MVIEESIVIRADIAKVWEKLTDLTCWKDWNTVLREVASETERLAQGTRFRFCLRPFVFPVTVEPRIEEALPQERIIWSGYKFGIFARHEFIFAKSEGGVRVTSRETFRGLPVEVAPFAFPKARLRELTIAMLEDLKKAAESSKS